VRGDKQKAAGKKERTCQIAESKERKQQEKKARIQARTQFQKREVPQVEAKKEIKARK
jgi:hypothetical protein